MKRNMFILLIAAFQFAYGQQSVNNTALTLSDHMTVAEIERGLVLYPPSAQNTEARSLMAKSMDKLVHFTVNEHITGQQVAELAPIRDFYLRQVDKGLNELESCKVTMGVRIFKFYSSSIIIKDSKGTVAVDFQQGPHLTFCGNVNTPDPVATKTGFHWTPAQLDRLARIIDVSLITHAHADHADYELTRRMAALGKKIIMTQQLKDLWSNLKGKLIVPEYGTIQQFGPVEVYAMKGAQYMENDKVTRDSLGNQTGHPSTNPDVTDAVTNAYLFRTGGLVFLQAGENNVPAGEWLLNGIAKGLRPDIKMSVGARQGAQSVNEVLKNMPVFFLPLHEYEMGHPNGGNRIAGLYTGNRGNAIKKGMEMPLFWGESYAVDATRLRWRKP